MLSKLAVVAVLLGMGCASSPPPSATTPAVASDVDVKMRVGATPWVYHLDVEVDAAEGFPIRAVQDELVVVERSPEGNAVVRGRCGWLSRTLEDPGCLPLMFPEGDDLGEQARRVEPVESPMVQLRDQLTAAHDADGTVTVRGERAVEAMSFIAAQGSIEGRYREDAGRYETVTQRLQVLMVAALPTGATMRSEGSVIVRLRYDGDAEVPQLDR